MCATACTSSRVRRAGCWATRRSPFASCCGRTRRTGSSPIRRGSTRCASGDWPTAAGSSWRRGRPRRGDAGRGVVDVAGPLLGPLADRGWAQRPAAELDRARLDVQIALNEARLSLADHAALARELPAQIERDPEVEPLRIQLVRASHAAGRTGEANVAYRRAVHDLDGGGEELQRVGDAWCAASSRRRAGCRPATETATATHRSRAPTPWCCAPSGAAAEDGESSVAVRRSSSTARRPFLPARRRPAHRRLRRPRRGAARVRGARRAARLTAGVALHVAGAVEVGGISSGPCRALWRPAGPAGPGQVLLSAEAAHAAERLLAQGSARSWASIVRDLHQPREVFALAAGGGDDALAEAMSLDRHPHNPLASTCSSSDATASGTRRLG